MGESQLNLEQKLNNAVMEVKITLGEQKSHRKCYCLNCVAGGGHFMCITLLKTNQRAEGNI